jgi:hypothetical protein
MDDTMSLYMVAAETLVLPIWITWYSASSAPNVAEAGWLLRP